MIRHHVVPRRHFYILRDDPKCPIDRSCLDTLRVTVVRDPSGYQLDNGDYPDHKGCPNCSANYTLRSFGHEDSSDTKL